MVGLEILRYVRRMVVAGDVWNQVVKVADYQEVFRNARCMAVVRDA